MNDSMISFGHHSMTRTPHDEGPVQVRDFGLARNARTGVYTTRNPSTLIPPGETELAGRQAY